MFKKWLAILGAVVLVACAVPLLWATGGGGPVEEHPWNGVSDGVGTSTTVGTAANTQPSPGIPLTRIYIVRRAPMGGFYLIRISLPSNASVKTAAGVKKAGN